METNNNIDRLLAMLDHPERYSEQEIMDTVNHDPRPPAPVADSAACPNP